MADLKEKTAYLTFSFSMILIRLLSTCIGWFSFIIRSRSPEKDLILFPHAQPGSDGYLRRFEEYYSFLNNDNIEFSVCNVTTDADEFSYMNGNVAEKYRFLKKCAWKRFRQVLSARHYKHAFIQRGLLLFFYDYRKPFLEKLLYRLCPDITIDYWDAVWFRSPELISNSTKYVTKISVVNKFIESQFSYAEARKFLFPLGVNTERYLKKKDYKINDEAVLFYTGQPGNVETFLSLISPILLDLKAEFKFKLCIVSKARVYIEGLSIEYFDFNLNSFFSLLQGSDIGLYAVENTPYTQGKMAMKVLDYMAAGLPCIATPSGLSPFIEPDKNIILAESQEEWKNAIRMLLTDESLRKSLGEAGRMMIDQHHDIAKSYETFKNIVFCE